MANGLLNLNEFKNKISKPVISSKYEVEINIPIFLQTKLSLKGYNLNEVKDKIKFLVHYTNVPEINISSVKVFHRGNPFNIRGATSFSEDWVIRFYNNSDMFLYNLFNEWIYSIDQYDDLITKSYFLGNYAGFSSIGAGYMSDAKLIIKNGDGTNISMFDINYVFPHHISIGDFNAQEQNTISSSEVRFSFSMFKKI